MPNLTNIPALDVVIGLSFVYFILSLALSSITESISAVLHVRWNKLEQGLRELFENSGGDAAADAEGKELWGRFQNDPRIRALWKQTGALTKVPLIGKRGPSYIPPRLLALTLLDTLAPQADDAGGATAPTPQQVAAATKVAADAKKTADEAAAKAAANPANAHAAAEAKAAAADAAAKAAAAEALAAAKTAADAQTTAKEAADRAAANPSDANIAADAKAAADEAVAKAAFARTRQMVSDHDLVARAERAAGSVKNPLLQKWLLDALTEVAVDRETILQSLESSFDAVTNRVSGWYKRYTAIVVAVLAFVAAGALNVDSYAIGSRLWKDDAVRTTITNQASNLTAAQCPPTKKSTPDEAAGGKTGTIGSTTSTTGSTTVTTGTAGTTGKTGTTGASSATQPRFSLDAATKCVTSLRALGLPIGWAKENRPKGWGWAGKAFGLIVTAFALMLGAPFWFDTLSKLARLRATGNPEGNAKKNGTSTG